MRSICEFDDVTGVILAGGRSTRMGRDKATLEIGGVSLFENILRVMQAFFHRVIIAGDRPDLSSPDIPCYADHYPGSALGGLYTGLYEAKTDLIFVASCDLPFPDPNIIRIIMAYRHDFDVVVPKTPYGLEPIFALYRKTCLDHMQDMLEHDKYRIYDFYPKVSVQYVNVGELPDGWENAFLNVNTPEEFQSARRRKNMVNNIISVVAKSGTGKTTLLEKLISELKRRSYRIGVLKHDAHRFDIDHEGKDSWRLTRAGADTMVISSKSKLAMVKRNDQPDEPSVNVLVEKCFDDVDIILTEGFKNNTFPKIEVHRKERSKTLLCRGEVNDETLIAIASDDKLDADVPVFDINDYIGICDFIEKRYESL